MKPSTKIMRLFLILQSFRGFSPLIVKAFFNYLILIAIPENKFQQVKGWGFKNKSYQLVSNPISWNCSAATVLKWG